MKDKLRLRFSKVGKIKYISHLDLMTTMRRALLRAGVRLRYSEGFNPHPFMSAALPLSVGYESVCELIDVGIADEVLADGLPAAVNAELPEGLVILEAFIPGRKFNEIVWLEIRGEFFYSQTTTLDAVDRLTDRFGEGSIIVSKKTKRGSSEIDITPFIRDIGFFKVDAGVAMKAKLSAQNPTITPDNLISALSGKYSDLSPDFARFRRMEVFDRDMNVFR